MNQESTYPKKAPWPAMRAGFSNSGTFPLLREWQENRHEYLKETAVRRVVTGGPIFSTPVVDENETIYCGSADHTLYAYNPLEDEVKWTFKTGEAIDCAAVLAGNGDVYVPSCDGKIYALNEQGRKKWEFDTIRDRKNPTPSSIFWWEGNAVLDKSGNVYAGNDDFYMYSFTPKGELRWSFATGLNIWTAPVFFEDLMIFCSFDFHVYALKQETGKLVWKTKIDNFCASSPALSQDGNVYFGTFGGTLYALNAKTGEEQWRKQLNEHIYASPAVDDEVGILYIGDASGSFFAFSARDGEKLWEIELSDAIRASATLGPDPEGVQPYLIYVGDDSGFLYAIEPTGEMRWSYNVRRETSSNMFGISASVALGNYGVAVATIEGDIVWVPYSYVLTRQKATLGGEEDKEVVVRKGDSGDWIGVHTLEFTQVVFNTPPVISSFDLVAIASVVYRVEIAVQKSGQAFGVGEVSFGSEEGDDGVTIPREMKYKIEGWIAADGSFTLSAKNCLFELSAFPIPVDELRFSGVLKDGEVLNPSIFLHKKKKWTLQQLADLLSKESIQFGSRYIRNLWESGVLYKAPGMVFRAIATGIRASNHRVQNGWRLTDEKGDVVAVGVYRGVIKKD